MLRTFEAAEKRRHREMYSGNYSMGAAEAAELVAGARKLVEQVKGLTALRQ